jgi:hypothetical protein
LEASKRLQASSYSVAQKSGPLSGAALKPRWMSRQVCSCKRGQALSASAVFERGDQSRSATADARGLKFQAVKKFPYNYYHRVDSRLAEFKYSPHTAAMPPSTNFFCSSVPLKSRGLR